MDTIRRTPHTIEEMEHELKEKEERLHHLKSQPMICVGTITEMDKTVKRARIMHRPTRLSKIA